MKTGKSKKVLAILLTITILCTVTGCKKESDAIRVGSKDFTESLIVAEIYALALEDAGLEVERKLNIAGSIVHTSIVNDEIDLYPEYTGTGLLSVLKMELITDPQEVYRVVKKEYEEQFDLVWLDSSKANDSQGLVIRTELAKKLNIATISDLQAQAEQVRFASQGEFDQRDDGIPGLEKIYGPFAFQSSKVYDNGLKYQILLNNEADATPAYTTEGQLVNTDQFTLLADDRQMWPPYYLAPVVRADTLSEHPEITEILNRISAALDTETVTALNAKADVEKQEYEEVAREFWNSMKEQ